MSSSRFRFVVPFDADKPLCDSGKVVSPAETEERQCRIADQFSVGKSGKRKSSARYIGFHLAPDSIMRLPAGQGLHGMKTGSLFK